MAKDKILYIDDEQLNLDGFEITFRDSYELLLATSANDALFLLNNNRDIKVIISDLRMPEISGLEFFIKIKDDFPSIVKIILTAFADTEVLIQALNEGSIYRYLMKPWDEQDLKLTIDSAIEHFNLKKHNSELLDELTQINTQLRESRDKFSALVTNTSDTIFSCDKNLQINFISPSVKEFGYEPEQIIGLNILNFIYYEDKKEAEVRLEHIFTQETSYKTEFRLMNFNGKAFHVEVRGKVIRRLDGEMELTGVLRNITERFEMETALKLAKEKAEESDRLKTAFLANMSHEIRTPLNGILGFSNLIAKEDLEPDLKTTYFNVIENSCNQLVTIIDDIMDLSRIEAGEAKVNNMVFSVNELLKELKLLFDDQANSKNISLELQVIEDNDKDLIYNDKTIVNKILANLLSNAIKYTETGKITVGYELLCQEKPNKYRFFVSDTGIGISKENFEIIFDRFRQIDSGDTRNYGGTGLGLAITKAMVNLLEGEISLSSELDKGSTFYFTLPF